MLTQSAQESQQQSQEHNIIQCNGNEFECIRYSCIAENDARNAKILYWKIVRMCSSAVRSLCRVRVVRLNTHNDFLSMCIFPIITCLLPLARQEISIVWYQHEMYANSRKLQSAKFEFCSLWTFDSNTANFNAVVFYFSSPSLALSLCICD